MPTTASGVIDLQHTVGNRAFGRLLDSEMRNAKHEVSNEPTLVAEVIRSSGKPLSSEVRAEMEDSFQEDFNSVRVHTDPRANESAKMLSARAYTKGEDIVFKQGEFAPGTGRGERLLAHELGHVVQQRQEGTAETIRRAPDDSKAAVDPEKELGEKLISQFPTGVAVAFYDSNLAEAERRAQDWATDQNSVGIKGAKVQADKLVFGKAIPDTHEIKTTLPALAGVLAAAVAKVPSAGKSGSAKGNPSKIRLLAIFSHGTPTWCGIGGGLTDTNAAATIKAIAPVVSPDLKVLLYSCSGALGPTEEETWIKGTLQGGGQGSVASRIRDAMVEEGIAQGEVWGHTTVGHVSENFALRYFTASSGKGEEGLAYAGNRVWGMSERINFLVQLQKIAENKGYVIDNKNSKKFFAEAAKATNLLMYACYAKANKTETYNGRNLAIAAPMNPAEVAAVIQKLWLSSYWTDEKKEGLAEKVIKAAALKKPK
jgi:Domain of unknown function (DUF4157)